MKIIKQPHVNISFGIDMHELVESVVTSLSFDEIHEFIMLIDKGCQDWGVTEKLHEYFSVEMTNGPTDEAEEA